MVGNGQQYVSETGQNPAAGLLTAARLGTALATACIGLAALVTPAAAGVTAAGRSARVGGPASGRRATAASIAVSCTSAAHPKLAARMATDIRAALRGRLSTVALRVEDRSKQLTCSLNTRMHFDSASVVKVIILGTLLRMAETQHRHLTKHEVALATAMITESDNDAASALWAEVGRGRLQYFLGRAKMTETQLGPGGYWGLTLITAHDEALLLNLLMYPNAVLTPASRAFALNLMARVIPAQRWGVPAGRAGRPDRAREERLAAAGHARLADPQHRLLHRSSPRLQHRGAHRGQPDHAVRDHDDRGCRAGDPPAAEPGGHHVPPAGPAGPVLGHAGRADPGHDSADGSPLREEAAEISSGREPRRRSGTSKGCLFPPGAHGEWSPAWPGEQRTVAGPCGRRRSRARERRQSIRRSPVRCRSARSR